VSKIKRLDRGDKIDYVIGWTARITSLYAAVKRHVEDNYGWFFTLIWRRIALITVNVNFDYNEDLTPEKIKTLS